MGGRHHAQPPYDRDRGRRPSRRRPRQRRSCVGGGLQALHTGSFQPNGTPGGGFYGRIRAKGITCDTARKVTQAWVRKMASGERRPTARVTVLNYSCKGTASGGALDVLCSRAGGTKAVKFHGQP